ncbi:MAG TPA: hypothetical protein VK944_09135, partial [Candidatus Limnocylindria bacterium]|nr:hypothetical protein [Candidatus Limnocylindria bacterium]
MREYRKLLIALGLMAFLTPIGLYLPQITKVGGAWGEWGIHEVRKMIGYAPPGMEKTADTWKAPMPDYAPPRPRERPPPDAGRSLPPLGVPRDRGLRRRRLPACPLADATGTASRRQAVVRGRWTKPPGKNDS